MTTRFVSQKLSFQIGREYDSIIEYADFIRLHTKDPRIGNIMEYFIGMPCDPFRRLIGFLTFQQIVVLLHQDRIDEAKLLTLKYHKFGKLFWNDGPIDLIESGRLLSSGK